MTVAALLPNRARQREIFRKNFAEGEREFNADTIPLADVNPALREKLQHARVKMSVPHIVVAVRRREPSIDFSSAI